MRPLLQRDSGSFKDPSGYVFSDGERIYRSLSGRAAAEFARVKATGFIAQAVERGLLIGHQEVDAASGLRQAATGARGEPCEALIEHPRLPLISYPYEWTFSQLQDAALLHLDLQLLALASGVELSDASAYNVQFHQGRPLHIDVLSLRLYQDGSPWAGYNQFCRQFLFPLLLESEVGIPFQTLYRGRIDGVDVDLLRRLIPAWRQLLKLNLLMHVRLHAAAIAKASSNELTQRTIVVPKLPKSRYQALLQGLRDWIAGLKSARQSRTYWSDYADINTYAAAEREIKSAFIRDAMQRWGCQSAADIGGNSGDYSVAALSGGAARVVCLDGDTDALERAYQKTKQAHPGLFPMVIDWCDPSPGQGWRGAERPGLHSRLQVDCAMALAVVHHIVFSRNVPLQEFVQQLFATARHVIVEFVPKEDAMVQGLLRAREDIFGDYDEANFVALLEAQSVVERSERIRSGGRVLFACTRK